MRRSATHGLLSFLVLVLTGCTGMKHISSGDPLYVGHKIEFVPPAREAKNLMPFIQDVLKPQPNNQFLWMRPALARYMMLSDSARGKKFWKNKITGPVLISHTKPAQVAAAIHNRIFHNGYFNNTVRYDTIRIGKRKAEFRYTITLREPYRYDSVLFPEPLNDLSKKIKATQPESLLKPGDIYRLEAVKAERARIDLQLKEKGYLYFNPEFIALRADSVTGDHQLKAEVTVKPETPPESRIPYVIRNVYIHADHVRENASTDTVASGNYYLIEQNKDLTLKAIQNGIFLKPGELYATSNYLHSVRYLNELPIVQNATVKFLPRGDKGALDAVFYLSQRKRLAYSAEFNTVFRSTNYFGPGIIFSYTDRNVKRGAEMLKINLRGRVEVQISQGSVNPAYELGLEGTYTVPRFYPGFLFNLGEKRLPKTTLSTGYNLFNRLDLYRMNSVFINFGYHWSLRDRVTHALNPVEVILTTVPESSKSEEFIRYLEENPGVQRSFDEQFMVGSGYEFTYSPTASRNNFFIRGGIDGAGNLLTALYGAVKASTDSLGRYTLFGVPVSQYVRVRADVRYSFNFNRRSKLVTRFVVGLGVPFGNSSILPYIKQFYVGGTNSLRSFVARSVGPGSETPPTGYTDLTGDIRLEGNLEYRFDLSGRLKGALFVDAGNVWLFHDDPSRPNGTFKFNKFLKEVAVSSGWGLRWDFDFIVARVDFGYTLRTPYRPEGERWATDFHFWDPTINIAIGYPF
ncbi:Surface antigen [Chryseolinea serpens]|uniref:Surface antigen n=1 Tax=Chryseolinea serpens TaxID=947013 RepID=A0A1M5QXB8_9BACT|nr:BamA/TamA family outer membrane protein [Chryseolinea serpens]SHH18817.1 Surface antigen [Chryseolinea serpens]